MSVMPLCHGRAVCPPQLLKCVVNIQAQSRGIAKFSTKLHCNLINFVISFQVGVIQQQQYRDNHQSLANTSCASPTSPASNPSYSPVASPGVPVGSPGSPASYTYADYIQQQQDTNALQQQFQEINMMQEPSVVVSQAGGVPVQYPPVSQHTWVTIL